MALPAPLDRWMTPDTRSRRLVVAAVLYFACVAVYAVVAGGEHLSTHTPYNHYAHLADAWLHGRQDLARGAPPYAQNNDFAVYPPRTPNEPPGIVHRTYISFPPFPAVLMLPFVWLAGSPENFRDGQFMIWVAGLGPALLFLVLEKLRRPDALGVTWSTRSERANAVLALLFAFGTVYFFTAEEGTVWFAAHAVSAAILGLYLLFAIGAEKPLLCGLLMGLAFATRPPTFLTSALFAIEAIRRYVRGGLPSEGDFATRARATWERLDKAQLARAYALFALPVIGVLGVLSWMNHLRFDTWNPSVGHEYLTVVWADRMQKWGLFGYHYLSKNLGVMLTILPWLPPKGTQFPEQVPFFGHVPFKINEHGLALWFTTPIYLWLLWPKQPLRARWLYVALAITAALPATMDLLYQNSGWRQFGYRFSNDYAPLLFVMLAIGDRAFGRLFQAAAAWSVAWNLLGACTFDRDGFFAMYYREPTQEQLYQKDGP
jgi:hypothetical protein